MASSNVMASTSPANPDLPRQQQQQQQSSPTTSSIHSLTVADYNPDPTKTFGSMNMDEFLKNIYSDSDTFPTAGVGDPKNKTVDEVWKEIVAGGCGGGGNRVVEEAPPPEMTLEDFLTKAGAVSEDEVRFAEDSMMNATAQFQGSGGFGNGIDGMMVTVAAAPAAAGGGGGGGISGRGKRRTVQEPPMDKATQQKQRRMIKNRESAARSRERKQAYTSELESLVTQLEAENAGLLREEAEQSKERYKQLMENLIPVVEKQRPRRALRRVNSMCW